jgi:hypothetical protein
MTESVLFVCWLPLPQFLTGEAPWPANQQPGRCDDCETVIQVQPDIAEKIDALAREIGPIPRVCIPCAIERTRRLPEGARMGHLGPQTAVARLHELMGVIAR